MRVKETDLFLLGLMSTMDAVLGRLMAQVVCEVPLSDEVRAGGTMVKISIASGYYQGARSEMSVGEI